MLQLTLKEVEELTRKGQRLIIVEGVVLDVSDLQDTEHKGGAVYDYGRDMSSFFGSVHGHAADQPSVHVEDRTVVQNLQDKVETYKYAHLTPFNGVRLDDLGHPWWTPHAPKQRYGEVHQDTLETNENAIAALADALDGIEINSPASRALGALVGGLVSDAAAQPTHWNYAVSQLHAKLEKSNKSAQPEFHDPSLNAFYKVPCGSQSCYGDQAYVLLRSLVQMKGLKVDEATADLQTFFGEQEEAQGGYGKLQRGELTQESLPIDGPWRHGSITQFVKGDELTDAQADCFTKILPVVCLYAGDTATMLKKVKQAVTITQVSHM